MMTLSKVLTRRDRCYLFGRHAARLSPDQSAKAWFLLADRIEAMGELDVPKFNDLIIAFYVATRTAKMSRQNLEQLIAEKTARLDYEQPTSTHHNS